MADAASASRIQSKVRTDLISMISDAVARQGAAIDTMVGYIATHFGDLSRQEPALFQQAHQDVGNAAMVSVVTGFNNRRFRRDTGPYRGGENRLSGRLGRALASRSNVSASSVGLSIINEGFLDREAAHWRRLNFGAGAGSREGIIAPQQFAITWGGVAAGVLGLAEQPSAAFQIPRGFWLSSGGEVVSPNPALGSARFYPGDPSNAGYGSGLPKQRPRITGGIASRNFIDAGVRRIANELPRAYQTLYEGHFARTSEGLKALARQPIPFHYRRSNR